MFLLILCIFCLFTWSILTSLSYRASGHWCDSFQFSIVWSWCDPLLAQFPCLLLHWLEYFYLILVLSSAIGIVKRPCEGMTHALGTSNKFTTKVWCHVLVDYEQNHLTTWWHSLKVVSLELFHLSWNPCQEFLVWMIVVIQSLHISFRYKIIVM